jgi:TonB-dependent SusC/RagA subfamily outer membrane receptor
MKKILLSLFVFMLIAGTTVAQNRTITGTVTDQSDGRPLPGVSVRAKGAVGGSQTGSDGKYSLSVPQGAASLEFSYIGYTTQSKPISTGNVINAVLQVNATELGEVIVIAYGTATKESFTGSVGVVKAADLKDRPVTSVDKALQGTVPGLVVKSSSGQPGSVSQIRLRGVGSINSSAEPLYVIDGVPITVGGDISMLSASSNQSTNILSTLNSEDIESISVLKDAASAALYGSKAANGVLIITTKKGKAGKTKIQAGATFGYSDLAVKQHELLNASEYFGIYWDANYKKKY